MKKPPEPPHIDQHTSQQYLTLLLHAVGGTQAVLYRLLGITPITLKRWMTGNAPIHWTQLAAYEYLIDYLIEYYESFPPDAETTARLKVLNGSLPSPRSVNLPADVEAVDFLRDFLNATPIRSTTVLTAAAEEGISAQRIYRASTLLRVRKASRGYWHDRQSFWSLTPNTDDA